MGLGAVRVDTQVALRGEASRSLNAILSDPSGNEATTIRTRPAAIGHLIVWCTSHWPVLAYIKRSLKPHGVKLLHGAGNTYRSLNGRHTDILSAGLQRSAINVERQLSDRSWWTSGDGCIFQVSVKSVRGFRDTEVKICSFPLI